MASTQNEATVADVMLRRPKTLAAETTVADARRMFESKSVRLLLVVEGGRFVGAVSEIPDHASPDEAVLSFADDEPPITTEPDLPVSSALERLGYRPSARLIVLDQDRSLLGLVCVTKSGRDFCGTES